MVSSLVDMCDAILADLMWEVPELRDVRPHRYAPWDPEQLIADVGERHLAVHPAAEAADTAQPLTTDGGAALIQLYRILYWEDAGDESSRGIVDENAARELLLLAEKIRGRFFVTETIFIGGSDYTEYSGISFPERSGQVRWFQVTVQARTSLARV